MAPVNILNLILCTVNMILLPYLAGYGFLHVLGIKPDKDAKLLSDKYVYMTRYGLSLFTGMLLSMTVLYVITVPVTWFRGTLKPVIIITLAVTVIFAAAGLFFIIRNFKSSKTDERTAEKNVKKNINPEFIFFSAVAVLIIAYYIYCMITLMHVDHDDSRYVVLSVDTFRTGTLLTIDPTMGVNLDGSYADFLKDFLSPWYVYMAYLSRLSLTHPAVMAHSMMPVIYTFVIALLMLDIGLVFFNGDKLKAVILVSFVHLIYIFAAYTVKSANAFRSFRIWQGKAMVACFGIPLLLMLFLLIYEAKSVWRFYVLVLMADISMCLMSGNGIILAGILTFCFGMVYSIMKKSWKMAVLTFIAVIPNAVLFLANHFLTIEMYLS
ncbi:MAG: hypothetical protein IJ619_07035 [Eubacterium sp.]|nr:hypothetical protein [Eubacterium sp.]